MTEKKENKKLVDNEVNEKVALAMQALDGFLELNQEQIDYIVAKASIAALDEHGSLAKLAVDETQRGCFEDKATKNMFACEHVINHMRDLKTVGVIEEDPVLGIKKVADPVGVICALTPVTNPTSTAIFKALIALKTRNPIIFSFHPSAQKSSVAAAKIVYDAALAAGAPKHCVQWIERGSKEKTDELMNHEDVSTILATGGNAMVRAAYSCGKPALGVGAGNVPSYIEKSAHLEQAVNDIVVSKSFDNGMVCASEQGVIMDAAIYDEAVELFKQYGVYFVNKQEKKKLEKFMFGVSTKKDNPNAVLNPNIVGQDATWIAKEAGFEVPERTVILAVECDEVGVNEPLTREKLSPVLAVLKSKDSKEGVQLAKEMVEFNGLGHSAAIHTKSEELVEEFGEVVPAIRIIWNSPSTFGGIGNIYNEFIPSLTLGCGSYGSNSVGDNVGAIHLLNIKKIGRRRNNMQWFKVPPKIYFEKNSVHYLTQMADVERVFVVTDKAMVDLGYYDIIVDQLHRRENPVKIQLFADVEPDPSLNTVKKGYEMMKTFQPDTIIALGGGSPMDAAKGMWMFYEHPDTNFDDLKQKFIDIRKRAFKYPELGEKAQMVCIPTTSGTGSEVTPFAVITNTDENNKKYPLADYTLVPDVAIVDPIFTMNLPKEVTADTGIDVLTHAVEAYVSNYANDYTDALAIQAVKMVFEYLERAVEYGAEDELAREKMHNASTMAGMAFGNAFLGMNHALAHKLGGKIQMPHGRINAVLLPHVIRYNGTFPEKPSMWPKYNTYTAHKRYAELARIIGVEGKTVEEGVENFANACAKLVENVGIKASFKEYGIDEKYYMEHLDEIAYLAYEDQAAPCNPRLPIVEDMKEILVKAYHGESK